MLENACRICEAKFGVLFDIRRNKSCFRLRGRTCRRRLSEYLRQRERRKPRPGQISTIS